MTLTLTIGLLATALVPAVNAAREASRQSQCRSNMRQIGLALRAYHDVNRVLPPAAFWGSEGLDLSRLLSHKDPTPIEVTRQNWVQLILPQMGIDVPADSFDTAFPMTHDRNAGIRMLQRPELTCASDSYNTPENSYEVRLADGRECRFARGNYAINGGSDYVPAAFGTLSNPSATENRYRYSDESREFQWWANGVAGINKCFELDEFRNGQSTLVVVDEVRAGLAPIDPRGVWSFGQIGGSITWGHGVLGDDGGPNFNDIDGGADDILGGAEIYAALGRKFIDSERMQACDHCNENFQATARSKHPGGVHVLMLDGAARFVSNAIDSPLWHTLHSSDAPGDRFPASWEQELFGPKTKEAEALSRGDDRVSGPQWPTEVVNSVGMKFVQVPAGEFVMGLPNADNRFAFPRDAVPHRVRLTRSYYLGVHEVTQGQYEAVTRKNPSWHRLANVASAPKDPTGLPVENVSWDEAVEFCNLLSSMPQERQAGRTYRLPTEAEWEYACRGGVAGQIPLITSWHADDKSGQIASKSQPPGPLFTVPVGSYPANGFGMHDMCGNVYEWVADFRARGYYKRSPLNDPQGPATGMLHVIRGWHWVATGPRCKVYVANEPWKGSRFIGFRVICDRAQSAEETAQ